MMSVEDLVPSSYILSLSLYTYLVVDVFSLPSSPFSLLTSYSDSVCPITVGGISALKGDLTPLLEFIQQN